MKRFSWASKFLKFLKDFINNLFTFPNHAFAAMTIVNYQGNVIVFYRKTGSGELRAVFRPPEVTSEPSSGGRKMRQESSEPSSGGRKMRQESSEL